LALPIERFLLQRDQELNKILGDDFCMKVLLNGQRFPACEVLYLKAALEGSEIRLNAPAFRIEILEISVRVALIVEQRGDQDFRLTSAQGQADQAERHRIGWNDGAVYSSFSGELSAIRAGVEDDFFRCGRVLEQFIDRFEFSSRHPHDEVALVVAMAEAQEGTEVAAVVEGDAVVGQVGQMLDGVGLLAQCIGHQKRIDGQTRAEVDELRAPGHGELLVSLLLSTKVFEERRLPRQIDGGSIDGKDPAPVKAQTRRASERDGDEAVVERLKDRRAQGSSGDAYCGVADGTSRAEGTLEEVVDFALESALDLVEEEEDEVIEGEAAAPGERAGVGLMGVDKFRVTQAFKYP
jgi:hypothetical protein